MTQPTTLADSIKAYAEAVPEGERVDALHQLFYGFYSRIAILTARPGAARWAKEDIEQIEDVAPVVTEALRDNALHVGRDLFATRMRTMSAMRLVSTQLAELTSPDDHPPFALQRAVAFDEPYGALRTYDLATPGEHPDPPYDPSLQTRRSSVSAAAGRLRCTAPRPASPAGASRRSGRHTRRRRRRCLRRASSAHARCAPAPASNEVPTPMSLKREMASTVPSPMRLPKP